MHKYENDLCRSVSHAWSTFVCEVHIITKQSSRFSRNSTHDRNLQPSHRTIVSVEWGCGMCVWMEWRLSAPISLDLHNCIVIWQVETMPTTTKVSQWLHAHRVYSEVVKQEIAIIIPSLHPPSYWDSSSGFIYVPTQDTTQPETLDHKAILIKSPPRPDMPSNLTDWLRQGSRSQTAFVNGRLTKWQDSGGGTPFDIRLKRGTSSCQQWDIYIWCISDVTMWDMGTRLSGLGRYASGQLHGLWAQSVHPESIYIHNFIGLPGSTLLNLPSFGYCASSSIFRHAIRRWATKVDLPSRRSHS